MAVLILWLLDLLFLVVEAVVLIIVACGRVGEASFGVKGLAFATIATVSNGFSGNGNGCFSLQRFY